MKRIIKFPLIMSNGKELRTIDELRENFNLEKVVEYYIEGKLKTWLQHRNYIEELSQLEELQYCDNRNEIPVMLCKIFNVEQSIDLNISEIERRKSRLSILKSFSDDEELEEKIEFIAFTQEELEKKLLNGDLFNVVSDKNQAQRREVYLCGEIFTVSDKFKNITYVGVNNPLVELKCDEQFHVEENNIAFIDLNLKNKSIIATSINLNHTTASSEWTWVNDIRISKEIAKEKKWYVFLKGDGRTKKLYCKQSGKSEEFIVSDNVLEFVFVEKWIFYVTSMGGYDDRLFRVQAGSTEKELILETYSIEGLTFKGEWIFFKGKDCCLNRVKCDGNDVQIISSLINENFIVTDEWIFYENKLGSGPLYRMKHDGSEKICVSNEVIDFKSDNDWLFFAEHIDGTSSGTHILYKMRFDGSGKVKVYDPGKFMHGFELAGDWIIYQIDKGWYSEGTQLYKVRKDGFGNKFIVDIGDDGPCSMTSFSVKDNWIFYEYGYGFKKKKFKIRLDGSEKQVNRD